MSAPTPGPRQKVDRACHPTLGEGVAVYNHGPAYFLADTGEVVEMRRISLGSSGVSGSWLRATDADGSEVRLDVTGREGGTRWERVVGQMHGAGWLGHGGKKHPTMRVMFCRFEPDAGTAVEFWISAMWVGLPKHDTMTRKLSKKQEKAIWEERKSCNWITIQTVDGSFFVYQREEDYRPDVATEPATAPVQMGLGL